MRILGIDYGDARTGLSISDPSEFLAGSPSVIHEWNYDKLVEKLVAFIEQNKIGEIVLGHPLNMDGTVGPRAEKCQALAKALEERTGLTVHLWDERRTTVAAHEILHRAGKKEKKHRENVDAVAATLILQGYLDKKRRGEALEPFQGSPVPTGRGKRGQDTKHGFLSPLDSPYLPSRCDSLRSRSEMRGAHRGVWCSKGTSLMEAELFAAERGRPAPAGRALTALPTTQGKFRASQLHIS